MNTCDYNHQTRQEVRILPYGREGYLIICKRHYDQVMREYREWAKEHPSDTVDLPTWESLKIYGEEIIENEPKS